ncbi:hypothetical protein O23A_p3104 [Aeromonas salmonicida]|nr:hypothetical protein O23A_p3104 [Aeromonas salmonicida]
MIEIEVAFAQAGGTTPVDRPHPASIDNRLHILIQVQEWI